MSVMTVAREGNDTGEFVLLSKITAGSISYFTVHFWICGVTFGNHPFENEVDARREYDAKVRMLGAYV